MQVLALRTVQNHTVSVDQCEFRAVAQEGDRGALDQLDANAVRQNTLHASGFNPGYLFQRAAPGIEGNPQHAASAVAVKLIEYRLAAHNVITCKLDLIGLEQQNPRRIQEKSARERSQGRAYGHEETQNEHTPVKKPGSSSELFPANLHRSLPAKVARLIFREEFRTIRIRVLRRGRVPRHGLHTLQTITSFSRSTS